MSIKKAGPICGNPALGLCFRECVEVTKVIDGCLTRMDEVEFIIIIDQSPEPYPFSFVSAKSSGETQISNVNIMPLDGRRAHITYDSAVPMEVVFKDANGSQHSSKGAVGLSREVTLRLPQNSLTPFDIRATTSIIAVSGEFISPTQVRVRCCVLQVSKVTAKVDVLVPSYGYCEFPSCENGSRLSPCDDLELVPLFPPFA